MKKAGGTDRNKEAYRRLRALSWERIWNAEVPAFNRSSPEDRLANVSLVRAVGVVFSESGPPDDRKAVAGWLRALLRDPEEKIRRYAMAALPKIGAGAPDEAELIGLLERTALDREKLFLGRALHKIGGAATLSALEASPLPLEAQKIRANVLRESQPGRIAMDRPISAPRGVVVHLRCRRGLEEILRDEAAALLPAFRVVSLSPGLVALQTESAFSLNSLHSLRCFATAGVRLGSVRANSPDIANELARTIASAPAPGLMKSWTDGPPRYRLEFVGRGHQRGLVREVARLAYAMCPDLLNDARTALWSVDIHPVGPMLSVELRPRLSPDPRFDFRRRDIPAASHPPLAACMARLAGPMVPNGILWDPFCGSGLEIIERTRLGGVTSAWGSDRSAAALEVAAANFAAAHLPAPVRFVCCDFRDFPAASGLPPGSLSQIITNPPLGRRVPVRNLPGLIRDLLASAASLLKPGGSLVFVNPVPALSPPPSLRLVSSRQIDLGGFDCRLEHYRKPADDRPRRRIPRAAPDRATG